MKPQTILNLIETFIAVSGVTGLEEGCYYYAPKAQELRQIWFKTSGGVALPMPRTGTRSDAGRCCSSGSQNICGSVWRSRLSLPAHGCRSSRAMNLAAIHLNLGVSGIAGFFDDQVNEVLGIPLMRRFLYHHIRASKILEPQRRS